MIGDVLMVCTGNICRSPMAEALLAAALGDDGVSVSSAGIGALVGYPADPIAVALLLERGLDISSHRARQVDAAMLSSADLVLVMDESHVSGLSAVFPQYRGKVHLLGRWEGGEIADPYRLPRAAFESALEGIEVGVQHWAERIGRLG